MIALGLLLSENTKVSAVYRHLDAYFELFPAADQIVSLDNNLARDVATSYNLEFEAVNTRDQIIDQTSFLFVFGGDHITALKKKEPDW